MKTDQHDLLIISTQVENILEAELDVHVGNMEALPLTEKLYKVIHARAYNQGLRDAKDMIERKLLSVTEELEILFRDE